MQDGSAADTGNTKVADKQRTQHRGQELVRTLEANGFPHLAAAVAQQLQDSDLTTEPNPRHD